MSTFTLKSKIVLTIGVLLFIMWCYVIYSGSVDTQLNYFYGLGLGILPLVAAFFGFINCKRWGGIQSSMGKTLLFLSLGLTTWGLGTIIFAYYNIVLGVAVPYPSVADLFYIVSWPLWAIGMISLSKTTGAKFQMRSAYGRFALSIIPLLAIFITYYLLVIVARGGSIAIIDDPLGTLTSLAYVVGDIVILTFTLLIYGLSFNYLGGYYKWPIMILLFGFVANYVSDLFFALTITNGTYFVANWVDLIFMIAFLLLGLGVTMIDPSRISDDSQRRVVNEQV